MDNKRLIIIGGGPGGYVAAIRAAQLGVDVTVVESRELGGTCLNRGCIPTKSIISSVELLSNIKNAKEHGITISGELQFDIAAMIARKNAIVDSLKKGIGSLFKSYRVKHVAGTGRITGRHEVEVSKQDGTVDTLQADGIIIATGSEPLKMPLFPFDGSHVITSDEAVNMVDVPDSILIVGAGVIGSEFAFIYNALGCKVIMVEMMPVSLSTEDSEISSLIQREMKKAKIELLCNTRVEKVATENGKVTVSLGDGEQVVVDRVLVSVGRSYNSSGIGLETIGVKTDERGRILVNERMETNIAGVYAIGDVTGGMMLAHVASAEGKIAASNFAGSTATMDYSVIPAGIFTHPEIGSVGITSDDAASQGIDVEVGRFSFKALGKARAMGETIGLVKMVVDKKTKQVLGMHIMGPHATDLVHEAAVAMQGGVSAEVMAETIHAHPTLAEGVVEAAEDVFGLAVHSPKKK